jgi:hypothetical protein
METCIYRIIVIDHPPTVAELTGIEAEGFHLLGSNDAGIFYFAKKTVPEVPLQPVSAANPPVLLS